MLIILECGAKAHNMLLYQQPLRTRDAGHVGASHVTSSSAPNQVPYDNWENGKLIK